MAVWLAFFKFELAAKVLVRFLCPLQIIMAFGALKFEFEFAGKVRA
jgi:hypothetical protein